jgi:hypothetical protein
MVDLAGTPAFQAALSYLRSNPPRAPRGMVRDATTIIRDEGRTEGWHEALDFLEALHVTHPDVNYKGPRYADPSAPAPKTESK